MALVPEKRHEDATVAVDFLLNASPEYFRSDNYSAAGTWEKKRLDDWVELNLKWLKEPYGRNPAPASLHLGESTPHIQALVVPLDERGHLNARELFGPNQLRVMGCERFDLGVKRDAGEMVLIEQAIKWLPRENARRLTSPSGRRASTARASSMMFPPPRSQV